MISSLLRTLARVPVPLRGVRVCVACDECFEGDRPNCPSCGSHEHVRLSSVLRASIDNLTGPN